VVGGVLLLWGFAALGFSSILARPVRRLANFAQQIRDGDQEAQLDWTWRQDEIGVLTRRLNWMSETMSTNESRLRAQERLQQNPQKPPSSLHLSPADSCLFKFGRYFANGSSKCNKHLKQIEF
jgi:HAMP domain-containing protein